MSSGPISRPSLKPPFPDRLAEVTCFFYGGLIFAAIERAIEVYFHFEDDHDLKFRNMHGAQLGIFLFVAGLALAPGSIVYCLAAGLAGVLLRHFACVPTDKWRASVVLGICLGAAAVYILACRVVAWSDDKRSFIIFAVWMISLPFARAITITRYRFAVRSR